MPHRERNPKPSKTKSGDARKSGDMTKKFRIPDEMRTTDEPFDIQREDRGVKYIRYIVGSLNEEAQKTWSDLWKELKTGVTPAGIVMPEMAQGFIPECGWAEFLEKFWLMKHYLDSIHRYLYQTPHI
jgi:hypothetical protein